MDVCAHLPLAIRLAAARLASRPQWRIQDLADRLTTARGRLDELHFADQGIRACFDISYNALSAEPGRDSLATRAFRLLGLWTGPDLGLAAASSLLGYPESQAERVLENLVDAHMVLSPSPGRYALHDLLRVYAAEKADRELDESERTAAITRLVTWYTEAAVAADVLLMPRRWQYTPGPVAGVAPPPELSSAADWAEREHANLVAAVGHAHGSGLHRLAEQLPTALFSFFHLRRHLDSWLSAYRTALASALESQDEAASAIIRGNLSVAYILMGRPHEAIELLHASLRFWQARGHDERAAGVLNNLGIAVFEIARPDDAIGYLRQSMAVYRASGNTHCEAGCHGNIGQIHLRLGDYSHAVEAYDAAEGLYRSLSDISAGLAEVLESHAEVHHALGRTAAAQAGLEEAVTIHRTLGDRHGLARNLELLGDIRRERTDFEGALHAWSESASILGGTDEARTSKLLAKIEKEAGSRQRPTGRN